MDSPFVLVPLLLLAFPLIWCGVMVILSFVSGWTGMASVYRATKPFGAGEHLAFRSARVGLVNYNNCMEYSIAEDGLYIRPFFLFRFRHPALCIPWSDITVEPTRFLWLQLYRLRMTNAPGKRITVRSSDFDRMKSHLKDA